MGIEVGVGTACINSEGVKVSGLFPLSAEDLQFRKSHLVNLSLHSLQQDCDSYKFIVKIFSFAIQLFYLFQGCIGDHICTLFVH